MAAGGRIPKYLGGKALRFLSGPPGWGAPGVASKKRLDKFGESGDNNA